MKTPAVLSALVFIALSCASADLLNGTWTSDRMLLHIGGKEVVLPVKKDDLRYSIWTFQQDGKLTMTQPGHSDAVAFRLTNDTIFITAANGAISAVPVVAISSHELRLHHLHAGDSVVEVFRRAR